MAQFNWRGVNFEEFEQSKGESQNGSFAAENSNMTCVWNTSWSDWRAATRALLGYAQVRKNGTRRTVLDGFIDNVYVNRVIPHFYIDFPGWSTTNGEMNAALYAREITSMIGLGKGNPTTFANLPPLHGVSYKIGQYEQARFTTIYKSVPFDVLTDEQMIGAGYSLVGFDAVGANVSVPDESTWKRWITKKANPSSQFVTIPAGAYKWVGGGPIQQGISKQISQVGLQITWHEVPETCVPSAEVNPLLTVSGAIERAVGRVNSVPINRYDVGTLLFLGVDMKPYKSPLGMRIFDITYMFKYFEPEPGKGHQFIYGTTANGSPARGWIEVTETGNSNLAPPPAGQVDNVSIYNWFDFKELFRPPGVFA